MNSVLQYSYMLPTSKYDRGRKPTPIKERIMKSISIDSNSCWVWQGKPPILVAKVTICKNTQSQLLYGITPKEVRSHQKK